MPLPSRSPHQSPRVPAPSLPPLPPPCLPASPGSSEPRSAPLPALRYPVRYHAIQHTPGYRHSGWPQPTPRSRPSPPKPTAYTYLGLVIYPSRIPPTAASSSLFIRTLLLPCLALSCRAILLLVAAISLQFQYLQHLSASIASATSDTTCSLAPSQPLVCSSLCST